MKLRSLTLFTAIAFLGTAVSAQTVSGLSWNTSNPSQVKIVKINPKDGKVLQAVKDIQLDHNRVYLPNTIHHDGSRDLLYFMSGMNSNQFFNTSSKLTLTRASTGEQLRTIDVSGSMAPFIVSERSEIGFIGVEREHHGYGNNDDNISLKVFDLNKGRVRVSVDLPNLSFAAINAPFIGNAPQLNGQKSNEKHLSLSSTCYLPDQKEIIFSATDVMDVQRVFRIDMESGQLISALAIDEEILDMTYDEEAKKIHALYVKTEVSGKTYLEVGTLNLNSRMFTHTTRIREIQSTEYPITDGSVKIGSDAVYVTKENAAGKQAIYSFDLTDHKLKYTSTKNSSVERVDFEFPYTYTNTSGTSLANLVTLYPNPSTAGSVTLSTKANAKVTDVTIRNNMGQTIQVIEVKSGLNENTLDVSALAPGMYYLEITTDRSTPVTEKLVIQ